MVATPSRLCKRLIQFHSCSKVLLHSMLLLKLVMLLLCGSRLNKIHPWSSCCAMGKRPAAADASVQSVLKRPAARGLGGGSPTLVEAAGEDLNSVSQSSSVSSSSQGVLLAQCQPVVLPEAVPSQAAMSTFASDFLS